MCVNVKTKESFGSLDSSKDCPRFIKRPFLLLFLSFSQLNLRFSLGNVFPLYINALYIFSSLFFSAPDKLLDPWGSGL